MAVLLLAEMAENGLNLDVEVQELNANHQAVNGDRGRGVPFLDGSFCV